MHGNEIIEKGVRKFIQIFYFAGNPEGVREASISHEQQPDGLQQPVHRTQLHQQ